MTGFASLRQRLEAEHQRLLATVNALEQIELELGELPAGTAAAVTDLLALMEEWQP